MTISGFPMKYSEDLKVLALGSADDTERHEKIASAASDIFTQKCAVRSETKARLRLEAKEIINISKEKINTVRSGRKSSGFMGLLTTMATATAILIPVAAIPIAVVAVSSNVIGGAIRGVSEKNINIREEQEKILVLRLFPESLRVKHINEKAHELVKRMFVEVDHRFKYKYDSKFFDSKEIILERVIIDFKQHIESLNDYIDKKVYFQD